MNNETNSNKIIDNLMSDISSWFNNHCKSVYNNSKEDNRDGIEDLKYNLEDAGIEMFSGEAISYLVSECGWSKGIIEEYKYNIDNEVKNLINNMLDYIEDDNNSSTSIKNKASWLDTAIENTKLSSQPLLNTIEKCKSILEDMNKRITILEKALYK